MCTDIFANKLHVENRVVYTCKTMFEIVVHRNVDNWIQLLTWCTYLVDQSRPCAQIYLQKNACCMLRKLASCINLQLPIVILKK